MSNKIGKICFDIIVGAGALACVLAWLEVKPKDVRMMTWPHWLWFIGALILFAISLTSSLRSLYLVNRKGTTELKAPPTLANRLFELATRYKKAAREFHKQNPQPPAPPASTQWATKANGWQKVNFHSELQRAHDELAAEGLSDVILDVAIESTPTLDRVEQITQRLRFFAAQLDDDPSDHQNARLPEISRKAVADESSTTPIAFKTPIQETISNRKFNNETVVMDGKRFYRCTFSNVTFEYHGTAATEFLESEIGGVIRLQTDHPAARTFSTLEHLLTSHHSVQGFTVGSLDAKGNELKPSYSIKQTAPYLEILAPLNHAEVGPWRDVRGSVQPPNSKVQVFVQAANGVWYMQSPVMVDGCSWNVKCKFGPDDVPSGDFQIIAIADGDIKDKTMHTLPNVGTARSEIVKVRRTH